MERGGSFEDGLKAARAMGITEADGAFDVEGWDSAAKTAALANVLMDARTTPQQVSTRGIAKLTPEVLDRCDILAATPGTSNLILFHTDLMGTFGTVSIEPTVEQTAYGVFSDVVNLTRVSG
jgi:homoserine dehydrogenase